MPALTRGSILEQTYEIIEEIGSGGGGIVYRARHLRLQTDVVVKKIKDEVRGKIRMRQEADILKKLKHPYLPRVYDFIETEDGVYTVMDFIHGKNLDETVKGRGKIPQKQVRKWAEQLGEALNYLHSQKPPIIHSDIKPANIMLTQDDNICLIDFNISLAMGGTMETAVGISAGFSPPEQYRDPALYAKITRNYTLQRPVSDIRDDATEILTDVTAGGLGETELLHTEHVLNISNNTMERAASKYERFMGKGIDERSDVYSLGITLYYLLTGIEPPVIFEQRIPIEDTNVSVSEGFMVILNKMMEFVPDSRYQNGGEFLKAIRNCHKLDHRYISMHRKQTGIQLAAIGCLAMGILFVFGGLYKRRMEQNSSYYGVLQQAVETMNQYEFEDAENLLEDAKDIFQTRIDVYEEEVHLLYLSEDYKKCISVGENYINTMPFIVESEEDEEQLANIYYLVGNAYFEMQDYANAKLFFENALEYYEGNALYYRDYAISLAKMGQTVRAEDKLKEGIELGLAQDSIYMAQGEIAHVNGQYEEAEEYLTQAIATTENMQMKKRAILLCTDVYKTMGNESVDKEIALLEQYISQFEGNGNLVMTEYLAEAYARKAKKDETQAQTCYERALDLFLSIYKTGYATYQLQENIAILYENMRMFNEAEDMLMTMAKSYPERYEVYKRLAFLEADKQQVKENVDRDYMMMLEYYEKAKEKYSMEIQDMEMDMLERMMQELKDGGWL